MLRHIPNFLTCCNLLCGSIGIIYIFDSYTWGAGTDILTNEAFTPAYFVWAACIFDFLDGFVARLLKANSPIGKELDSLADVISFGLLPALFMYKWIDATSEQTFTPFVALSIAAFSALRLAKFNIDETQADSFKGVPTPANALFITSLPFLYDFSLAKHLLNTTGLVVITILFSFLLVSRFGLFALKFKDFKWRSNQVRFTFLALAVLLLLILKFAAIPLIIILYILLSLITKKRLT